MAVALFASKEEAVAGSADGKANSFLSLPPHPFIVTVFVLIFSYHLYFLDFKKKLSKAVEGEK